MDRRTNDCSGRSKCRSNDVGSVSVFCASSGVCRLARLVTLSIRSMQTGAKNACAPRTSVRCTKKLGKDKQKSYAIRERLYFCRRWRGIWFDASVKTRRKSLAPMYKSKPSKCFVFRDDTITGTMLSIVCGKLLSWSSMNT